MSYHDTNYSEAFEAVKPCYSFLGWSGGDRCYICNVSFGGVKLFTFVVVYVS